MGYCSRVDSNNFLYKVELTVLLFYYLPISPPPFLLPTMFTISLNNGSLLGSGDSYKMTQLYSLGNLI